MGIATITLDAVETRNALSAALIAKVRRELGHALADDGARVIVLTHEGPVFSAGADLKAVGHRDVQPYIDLLRELWHASKPVVGVVRGAARGGGMGLVAACDIVVASEGATFGFPEVRVGAVPAMVAAVVMQKVGRGAALELFLTGDAVPARRAHELGLVNAVADDPAPWIESLRKGGPGALAAVKRIVNDRPGLDDLEQLGAVTAGMFESDEVAEGIAAFLEKRPARWAQ